MAIARALALVNRVRQRQGLAAVNHKRALRVMQQFDLTLPKAPKKANVRRHDGKVMVATSDTRWCSDGFEIKCDNQQVVTVAFTKDCADREIIAWQGTQGRGLGSLTIQSMLIQAVESRFSTVEQTGQRQPIEFLSDNGSAYIAKQTRDLARQLGLEPVNTPAYSPQSNGMAESFVNTFRRDYEATMDETDALTVLRQLPTCFEHYNEVHPHSALNMMSPRMYRRNMQQELSRHAQPMAIN